MSISWISLETYVTKYIENEAYDWKLYLSRIIERFLKHYPSPEDWLNTKTDEKVSFKIFGYSEIHYIACWALDNEIYKNKQYSSILLDYFLDKRHARSNVPLWLARKLSLLSDNDILAIREHRIGIQKRIAIHCLFISKPLSDFNNNDVMRFPILFKKPYSAKLLQDLRIKLGYANTIIKRKSKITNWDKLVENPMHGLMLAEFKDYLIRCDATTKYISKMGTTLTYLFNYLEMNNLNNCSNFDDSEFKLFTEYLLDKKQESSVMLHVAKLKKFFSWGVGVDSFFPTELNYPSEHWKELIYKAKIKRKESDGRSFSEPDMANKIVTIIYNYIPINELEMLCRSFWLILATCPARLTYIQNLSAIDTVQPMPNEQDVFGIYSALADKAGNKYGQFPILDKIGLEEIRKLQNRAKELNLSPIQNPENNKIYIHLFQLTNYPWILDKNSIRIFFEEKVKPELNKYYPNFSELRASAHGFRHHLLTHIAYITGDISVVQTAAGHREEAMTREYLRSKISRDALLFRVMRKFETREITGRFYLRLVELLSSEETPTDLMMSALTTEMKIDEFINKFGKRLEMGYCFNNKDCSNWLKCWSCINFLMTKDEITSAIKCLAHQMLYLRNLQCDCSDFTYDHPVVYKQLKTISLIVKRLSELDLTETEIVKMVDNYIHLRNIEEGVVNAKE